MPLEPRPKTEAYRLCQPMHVLSFGEGRKRVEFVVVPSPIWDSSVSQCTLVGKPIRVVRPKGVVVNSCDHENT